MSSLQTLTLALIFFFFFTFIVAISSSSDGGDRMAGLLELQSGSRSGEIHLDNKSLARFLTSVETLRPYTLAVFFDAVKLHDKRELNLKDLRSEFAVVASSFATNTRDPSDPSHGKLFFCDVEFKEFVQSFALFGVNALPHVRLVSPSQAPKDSDQMDQQGDFSRLADSMAEFIESKMLGD